MINLTFCGGFLSEENECVADDSTNSNDVENIYAAGVIIAKLSIIAVHL